MLERLRQEVYQVRGEKRIRELSLTRLKLTTFHREAKKMWKSVKENNFSYSTFWCENADGQQTATQRDTSNIV